VTRTRALVRGVPDAFVQALRPEGDARPDAPISIRRAREQHAGYVAALESFGLAVESLEADERYPDCCFVEDPVLVVGDLVLSAPMAAASRRGEAEAVLAHLADGREVVLLEPPATLDGGDVVQVGRRLFVGRSGRTNDAAAAQLEALLRPRGIQVTQVDVRGVLHLKSACTHAGGELLLHAPGACDPEPFAGLELLAVPEAEARAANVVALEGAVLVSAGFPRTAQLLAGRGLDVRPVEAGEFALAGGSLTCLSVLLR
jgi:dimethylargininase